MQLLSDAMQKGQMEVWISSLPGFPDGISQSKDGNYWVAMAGPNQPFVKALPYRFVASAVMLLYITSITARVHSMQMPDSVALGTPVCSA